MTEREQPQSNGTSESSSEPSRTHVGNYEIIDIVGHGASSTVYRAIGPDGKTVAIKRISVHSESEERAAVQREAAALAVFHHPSVLKLIDVIDSPTDLAIVTEYLSGGSLRDHLKAHGPFSDHEVLEMLSPIAAALAEAHRHSLLHRDVKPSNVLRRGDGTTVLADFGLAIDDPTVSQTNTAALGSAAYLDPEVIDGAKPSQASDTYALGVVAYELLTGHPPFHGESTLAVLRNADRGVFPPLDRATFGGFADQVERSFSRHSENRFPSADALLTAWQSSLGTASVSSNGTSDGTQHASSNDVGSHPDDGATATTVFIVPTRPSALSKATPVKEARNWKRIGAVAAGLATLGTMGGAVVISRSNNKSGGINGVVSFKVACDPSVTAQCVESFTRTPDGMSIRFKGDDQPTRFAVGKRTDALRVSNFFCGSSETLALYRPSTGTIYYFREWPLPGKKTEIRADATGILNASIVVSDYDDDGCGDIGLERGNARVWFLPSEQSDRLRLIAEGDAP
jgi:serine/threonine protein kinase